MRYFSWARRSALFHISQGKRDRYSIKSLEDIKADGKNKKDICKEKMVRRVKKGRTHV